MKILKFENLIDVKTGKPVEVEVPDDFNVTATVEAGKLGAKSGERLLKVFRNEGITK